MGNRPTVNPRIFELIYNHLTKNHSGFYHHVDANSLNPVPSEFFLRDPTGKFKIWFSYGLPPQLRVS